LRRPVGGPELLKGGLSSKGTLCLSLQKVKKQYAESARRPSRIGEKNGDSSPSKPSFRESSGEHFAFKKKTGELPTKNAQMTQRVILAKNRGLVEGIREKDRGPYKSIITALAKKKTRITPIGTRARTKTFW